MDESQKASPLLSNGLFGENVRFPSKILSETPQRVVPTQLELNLDMLDFITPIAASRYPDPLSKILKEFTVVKPVKVSKELENSLVLADAGTEIENLYEVFVTALISASTLVVKLAAYSAGLWLFSP